MKNQLTLLLSVLVSGLNAQVPEDYHAGGLEFEIGGGIIALSNTVPDRIPCFEGCTPIRSLLKYSFYRGGLQTHLKAGKYLNFAVAVENTEMHEEHGDDFSGGTFQTGAKDVELITGYVLYGIPILERTRWGIVVEGGLGYSKLISLFDLQNIEKTNKYNGSMIRLATSAKLSYYADTAIELFGRVRLETSLYRNIETDNVTKKLANTPFIPVSVSLGIRFPFRDKKALSSK